jgi:hypothetical protein
MTMLPWHRRCILGRHGPLVVTALCAYEIAALTPRSPLWPITKIARRYPPLGVALVLAFGHHLLWELEEAIAEAVDAVTS